jgi:hypothetical protein
MMTSHHHLQNNASQAIQSSHNHTLTHKRSDITVDWSDSMNDVSLTGYFLNDMQSPEKNPNKNSLAGNLGISESSRDSILFNMDTIMDILPPNSENRFEESSNGLQNNLQS